MYSDNNNRSHNGRYFASTNPIVVFCEQLNYTFTITERCSRNGGENKERIYKFFTPEGICLRNIKLIENLMPQNASACYRLMLPDRLEDAEQNLTAAFEQNLAGLNQQRYQQLNPVEAHLGDCTL